MEKTKTANKNVDLPYAHDLRWLLVERILATPDFERSPRLSEFLRYICRLALEGRSGDINEQHLGEVVFGRPAGYDSSADSIVRSHALRLRHRLELFFSSDGAHEPLQIEIPRGGYVPHFHIAEAEAAAAPEMHALGGPATNVSVPQTSAVPLASRLAPEQAGRFQHGWIRIFLAGAAMGAIAIAAAYGLHAALTRNHSETGQLDIERRFWTEMFPPDGRTLIVPGDSGLVLYETVTGQDVSLSNYINGTYPEFHPYKILSATISKALSSDLASRRYTSIIDLDLTSRLSHLPEWTPEHAAIVYARDLRPVDAARSNIILIGSRQANPWVSLVEPSMNFILTRGDNGTFYFVNRQPRDGESKEYHTRQEPGDLGAADVYGDVAYLPNPGGSGMVLVLSGLWMSGTQSAGEFVLDENRFSNWLKSIANPDGTIPPFELLIATKNLQGSTAYSSIVAKRVLSRQSPAPPPSGF
ncbi:MAG TPA: hypothetical protein VHX20_08615 [Terracidiphilus sp.]|nr:hypothetical protein [Terracidiphilus sp.]